LHGGFGAMADDAIAGLYSAAMVALWPWLALRF
jgi:phosphatidylglycerophosphatase A